MTERTLLKPEPVWYLRSLPYGEYRNSDHWKLRREEFRRSHSPRCMRCLLRVVDWVEIETSEWFDVFGSKLENWKRGASKRTRVHEVQRQARFHVHHLTYERIGCEPDEDLELLCSACHNLDHYPLSAAANCWSQFLFAECEKPAAERAWPMPDDVGVKACEHVAVAVYIRAIEELFEGSPA